MGKRKQGPTVEPMRILLEIAADFKPEDGDAFDAVVEAMDFSEIPAVITLPQKSRFEAALEPMAAISTAHLSEATLERVLAGGEGYEGLVHYPNEFGAFLMIERSVQDGTPGAESWPQDLVSLVQAARDAGLQWLKLDADAVQVEGLAVYPRIEAEVARMRCAG